MIPTILFAASTLFSILAYFVMRRKYKKEKELLLYNFSCLRKESNGFEDLNGQSEKVYVVTFEKPIYDRVEHSAMGSKKNCIQIKGVLKGEVYHWGDSKISFMSIGEAYFKTENVLSVIEFKEEENK